MNITIINIVRQIFFRDETSDKPKENRVVKFHDEAPERGRPAKKSMKVMMAMLTMMMMIMMMMMMMTMMVVTMTFDTFSVVVEC